MRGTLNRKFRKFVVLTALMEKKGSDSQVRPSLCTLPSFLPIPNTWRETTTS